MSKLDPGFVLNQDTGELEYQPNLAPESADLDQTWIDIGWELEQALKQPNLCDCHQSKGRFLDIPHADWCQTNVK